MEPQNWQLDQAAGYPGEGGKWGNLDPGPYDPKVPRTRSTAQITKEPGSSSPQLVQAYANADMFDERDSLNGIQTRL